MRIGAKLPNSGPLSADIPSAAAALERAGFDSLWVADHIVMPETIESRYPFAADGRATWPTDTPYVDALIALALAAAVTSKRPARDGGAGASAAQPGAARQAGAHRSTWCPAGGWSWASARAGWRRSSRRSTCRSRSAARGWTSGSRSCASAGRAGTERSASEFYDLPAGTLCLPAPSAIPILIGGHSPAALRRAERNDGWLAQQDADQLDPAALQFDGRVVLRIVGSLGREELVAKRLAEFERVDEVIVDVPIDDAERVREVYG